MNWKFEEEFRLDKPETIGEKDTHFYLDNYKDWLEFQLAEARKQLSQNDVIKNEADVCDDEWHESNMLHFGKYDKEEFELQRLYDWLLDENREPVNTKFTAGKTRNVAREIEFLLKKK